MKEGWFILEKAGRIHPKCWAIGAWRVGMVIVLVCGFSGCRLFDPNYQAKTSDDVRLVLDSQTVRGLILEREAHEVGERASTDRYLRDEEILVRQNKTRELKEMLQHPETYVPRRIAFLDAISREPIVVVKRGSFCQVLLRSHAICSRLPEVNPYFIEVRVTTGKSKGVEGWGCLGDGIGLTTAWP